MSRSGQANARFRVFRKLKSFADARGLHLEIDRSRGKGSHQTLRLGHRKTTIPDLKKEMRLGTLRKILKDLGFESGRLEDL